MISVGSQYQSNGLSAGAAAIKDGFEWVDLEEVKPDEAAIQIVPGDFALKNQILPLHIEQGVLVVAIGVPQSLNAVDELGILLQRPTRAVLASPSAVKEKIEE